MPKMVGSKFMITQQLKKVFRESIPRIQSFEEAQQMEAELRRARSGKIFDDKTYLELHIKNRDPLLRTPVCVSSLKSHVAILYIVRMLTNNQFQDL